MKPPEEKKEQIKARRKIEKNRAIGCLVMVLLLFAASAVIIVGTTQRKKPSDSSKPHWEGGQIILPDADQINKANEYYRRREQEEDKPIITTSSFICPYCGAEGKELSKKYIFTSGIPLICSRYGDKHMWVYVR